MHRNLLADLALVATGFAWIVIGLGAFTRLIDAGLGCPDWPGCYGHLVISHLTQTSIQYPSTPLVAYKAYTEMIHRYSVAILSLLMVAIIVLSFWPRYFNRTNRSLNLVMIVMLIYQIILGRWTVTLKLLPLV